MTTPRTITVAVITGTTRAQRMSGHIAALVAEVGRGFDGVEVVEVDPNDFDLSGDGNDPEGKDPRYTAITARADAFLLVSPEYNHGYPGSLKRLLDSELENYLHKPVAFVGVSATPWGGVRGVEALVGVTREMGMVATSVDAYLAGVSSLFPDGTMSEEDRATYSRRIARTWEELLWFAQALGAARQADG